MKFTLKSVIVLVVLLLASIMFTNISQVNADPSDPFEYQQFSCYYEVHEGNWKETGCNGIDPATWQDTWDWCSASAGVAFTGEWKDEMPWEGSAYYNVYCSRGTYVDPDPYTGPLDPSQNPEPTEPEATPTPDATQEPGTTTIEVVTKVVKAPIQRFVPPQPPEVAKEVISALARGTFTDGMVADGYTWGLSIGGNQETYLNRYDDQKGASWLLNADKRSIKCKFSDWDPAYGIHREESCLI